MSLSVTIPKVTTRAAGDNDFGFVNSSGWM
jgi:hypothetical protein